MKFNQSKKGARYWLIRIIWALAGISAAGIILGGILLASVFGASGWKPGVKVEAPAPSQTQLDKYLTSVLVAVQNQPLATDNAPADMAFIVSFNALSQKLTIAAISTDLLLDTGSGQYPVGALYGGSPELLLKTVNANFGLNVQNFACTDTHSLAAMIDLLGGIETRLTKEEAEYIKNALGKTGAELSSGRATLSGMQCMVHALDGISGSVPFGGEARRLALMESAITNMRKTATKEAMLPLLAMVFSNIRTNLDLEALRGFAYEILKSEDMEIATLVLPAEGSYQAVAGEETLKADISENAALLQKLLYAQN